MICSQKDRYECYKNGCRYHTGRHWSDSRRWIQRISLRLVNKAVHCVWLYWLGIVNVNVCIGCVLHWNRIWVGLSYPNYGACSFRLFGRNNIPCLVFSVFPQFRTLMCLPAGGFSYYTEYMMCSGNPIEC